MRRSAYQRPIGGRGSPCLPRSRGAAHPGTSSTNSTSSPMGLNRGACALELPRWSRAAPLYGPPDRVTDGISCGCGISPWPHPASARCLQLTSTEPDLANEASSSSPSYPLESVPRVDTQQGVLNAPTQMRQAQTHELRRAGNGMLDDRWTTVTESEYEHERRGLEAIRRRLPDEEPWRAWSNFTFTANSGHVREVDLLVVSAGRGLPDRAEGLARVGTRRRQRLGADHAWRDPSAHGNPLHLANQKAKELAGLINASPADRRPAEGLGGRGGLLHR